MKREPFDYLRRKTLALGSYIGLSALLVSCKATEQVRLFQDQFNAQLREKQLTFQQKSRIQQLADMRFNKAVELTTPEIGFGSTNFDKAYALLEENFSVDVRAVNKDLWARSKVLWITLIADEELDEIKSRLPILKQAIYDVDNALLRTSLMNVGTILAIAGMTVALLENDLNTAEEWYEYGEKFTDKGLRNNVDNVALTKMDLAKYFSLGALVAIRNNQFLIAWNRVEAGQTQSVSSPKNNKYPRVLSKKILERQLKSNLTHYGALVCPVITIVGSYYLTCTLQGNGIAFSIKEIRSVSSTLFNRSSLQHLLYGTTFRKSLERSYLGGWMGIYAAQDENGSFSQSNFFRDSIEKKLQSHWNVFGHSLLESLQQANVPEQSHVKLVVPDGLFYLPIRAAMNLENDIFLIDKYIFTQSTGVISVNVDSQYKSRWKNTLLSMFNQTNELAGVGIEKSFVENSLQVKKAKTLPFGLNHKSLLKRIAAENSQYVFFSSHGMSFGDKSGLLIGQNQLLQAEDLHRSSFQSSAELVILSACEVGMVSPIDLNPTAVNLATSFLGSGVKGVIAALWRVEVDATTLLMCKLLEEVINNKEEPAAALSIAQQWLRSASRDTLSIFLQDLLNYSDIEIEPIYNLLSKLSLVTGDTRPYSSPYYWGAFIYLEA